MDQVRHKMIIIFLNDASKLKCYDKNLKICRPLLNTILSKSAVWSKNVLKLPIYT